MFAESLLESGNVRHRGRGWATTLSITLQSLLLAALVALPIFRPDKLLLENKPLTSPIAFGRQDAPHESRPTAARPAIPVKDARFIYPGRSRVLVAQDSEVAPEAPYVPGPGQLGRPDGVRAVFDVIAHNPPPVHLKPAPPVNHRVSVPQPGKLVHQVQPVYPVIAKRAGIQGEVVMHAIIDRQGRIVDLQVIRGPALLQEEAVRAVTQWRYLPYLLNGEPVEVETQITVNFILSR